MSQPDTRPPPPDPAKPYIWIGGQWWLVATDTSDGVPDSLEFSTDTADDAAGKTAWERDVHHALGLVDTATRDAVLEALAKAQGRDRLGRFAGSGSSGGGSGGGATNMTGGPLRSSIPGQPGGPPLPRASLAQAKTTAQVAAVTSRELQGIMGRPVPVDFSGLSPAIARESGEGLLMAAKRYPKNDLRNVQTYGPGGTRSTHPGDPMFEAAAITDVHFSAQHADEMHFSTIGGEKFLRAQYASSASMGGHAAPHPTGVAVHEMGHVVSMHSSADITSTNLITARATAAGMGQDDQHVSAYVGHQISIYGGDSPPEAMAEAFADVLVNGSSARPLSKDIHTIIDAYYQSVNLP